jgi:hypothetical protein
MELISVIWISSNESDMQEQHASQGKAIFNPESEDSKGWSTLIVIDTPEAEDSIQNCDSEMN